MKTIFVVDDDPEQAELLAQALAGQSQRVRAFSDPIRALAALSHEKADLLIADVSMPWIDGKDVVASTLIRHPNLPIILVSAYSRGSEIAAEEHVQFFPKPIDLDALRATVSAIFRGAGGQPASTV